MGTGGDTKAMLKQVVKVTAIGAVTLTALWGTARVARYFRRQLKCRALLDKYRSQLIPSKAHLLQLRSDFVAQMEAGLGKTVEPNGKEVMMLPSYVVRMPDGSETGDVYALDIGGTNFRVMYLHLSSKPSEVEVREMENVAIPEYVYKGSGPELFDFMAKALASMIEKHPCSRTKSGQLPVVGFCFSFPMAQPALNQGILLDWTKGFECEDVINKDVVQFLSEAMERQQRPVHVAALLNDTVGVLAAHRYVEPTTCIGVIVGTGTNACYVERVARVAKWRPQGVDPAAETVINIEWGAFFSPHLPFCEEDARVDATTNPGKYLFEKLVSGLFLGETARHIMLTFATQADLFCGVCPPALLIPGSFPSAALSVIVEDEHPLLLDTAEVLRQCLGLAGSQVPYSARITVRRVCTLVAWRSARLVAAALDGILTHTGWHAAPSDACVVFDGGVYSSFGAYRAMLQAALRELLGSEALSKLKLQLAKDGSSFGAAVLAAAAAP